MVKKIKKVTLAKPKVKAKSKKEDVVYDESEDEEDEKERVEAKEPEAKEPEPAPPTMPSTADVSEQAFQPAPPPDQQPKLFPEPKKEK